MDNASFDPTPGQVELLEPGIRRILAPNPSPMTFRGTNSYIVGQGKVAVIDPGPASPAHLDAILAALDPGEKVSHIFVTHSHLDHSPLAQPLSQATGAVIHAFGDSFSGRSGVMETLAAAGVTGGGEGVDAGFTPHEVIADGAKVSAETWRLTAIWTPGHFGNHLSFAYGDAVFTGDHIMGWASTMISPPDGDVSAFMDSTERLAHRCDRVFYPGHGAPVNDPATRAKELLAHRRQREAQILARLDDTPRSVTELTQSIYVDVPRPLLPAAERNVFAHLIDLHVKNFTSAIPNLARDARFVSA